MTSKYLIPLLTSVITACSIYPALGQETTASEITFTCEDNNNTPITIARDKNGQTKTLFYWKEEALANKTRFTTQELCSDVSEKLNNYSNDYSIKLHDTYSFDLLGTEQSGMPVICIGIKSNCSFILFLLSPPPEKSAAITAFETLEAILNPNIVVDQRDICRYRGCCPLMEKINLFNLN